MKRAVARRTCVAPNVSSGRQVSKVGGDQSKTPDDDGCQGDCHRRTARGLQSGSTCTGRRSSTGCSTPRRCYKLCERSGSETLSRRQQSLESRFESPWSENDRRPKFSQLTVDVAAMECGQDGILRLQFINDRLESAMLSDPIEQPGFIGVADSRLRAEVRAWIEAYA